MKDFLHHLFVPRESNNHRAKILHNSTLSLVIIFLFLSSFFIQGFKEVFPSVLGIANNINVDYLLVLTNKERTNNGVSSLTINASLSQAAARKAEDMFAKDYWAHNSPDGKTPWVFIKDAGYNYVYAGENLARGFSTSEDVVAAWLASPTHKANMLSSNYKDVGFAVVTGKLNGEDTVLVVEEFGNQSIVVGDKPVATAVSSDKALALAKSTFANKPVMNSVSFASNTNRVVLFIFLFALILDMIIVERKKIVRFVGHNIDHIFYFIFVLLLVGVLTKGVVI
ncbi:MAG: CAP domain-containing protein [Patescibacteria group bacterium]